MNGDDDSALFDWQCIWRKGTITPNPDPTHFKVEGPISRWGKVKSMRFSVYRDGKPAFDIWHHDWGVGLKPDPQHPHEKVLWFSMQFHDRLHGPSKDHEYVVTANIELGEPE